VQVYAARAGPAGAVASAAKTKAHGRIRFFIIDKNFRFKSISFSILL